MILLLLIGGYHAQGIFIMSYTESFSGCWIKLAGKTSPNMKEVLYESMWKNIRTDHG